MGRALKKVALDLKWPTGQIWKGYLNPFNSQKCKSCDQTGLNLATKDISDTWYSFDEQEWLYDSNNKRYNNLAWSNHLTQLEVDALVDAGRLVDFTHDFVGNDKGWVEKNPAYRPNAEDVNLWSRKGMGHDAINKSICVKARAESLGVYGVCEHCQGDGEIWQSEEIKKMNENWENFGPPEGEGFQLWSTTTEGHPMTPVFATLEALCEYCETNRVPVFAADTLSAAEWLKSLGGGDSIVTHQIERIVFI